MKIETEATKKIIDYHLDRLCAKTLELSLNLNQVLALVELLDIALHSLPLHEMAREGFLELVGALETEVLNAYPDIEPYLNQLSILEGATSDR